MTCGNEGMAQDFNPGLISPRLAVLRTEDEEGAAVLVLFT